MWFEPVSDLKYHILNSEMQILVCSLSDPHDAVALLERWKARAVATFSFGPDDVVGDVVRDLLANPQVRAIVFDGQGDASRLRAFWKRELELGGGIEEEHLELVRQFVDLFDGDCVFHKPQQPFWPKRLKYQPEPVH